MPDCLPLSALLSQAFVAFTIEFDNEFEHQVPHRTTNFGATGGHGVPWLVSMVMWSKFLRHIPETGITVRDLLRASESSPKSLKLWLTRLSKWWGYVTVEPNVPGSPPADWCVRPTLGGLKAIQVWRRLTATIESRWDKHFGKQESDALRSSFRALNPKLPSEIPSSMPILGYGLTCQIDKTVSRASLPNSNQDEYSSTLPALVSRVLLAFAIEFEHESHVSLAISANVLRLCAEVGIRICDLPRLAGVSKASVAVAAKFLEARGFASIESAGRAKILVLTSKGREARNAYVEIAHAIERRWSVAFGKETIAAARRSLEKICSGDDNGRSKLLEGLKPHLDNWRASEPPIETLPHFPIISHRGGYPDGS